MFNCAVVDDLFHPAVDQWFRTTFDGPTLCQTRAWPAIRSRTHTLIAAPTGSGKTLAAFLCAIDDLLREGLARHELPDATQVLYVSPLKALSNDVQRNLEQPLAGVREQLCVLGLPDVEIQAWVRTGDTPQSERERMRRKPPHILVTTPESLYILLTSDSGRSMLSTVRTVIVDEIHAVADNKRGAHLALSLERLATLTEDRPTRIGLSATQKPVQEVANFLTGDGGGHCEIVDIGHVRKRDLAIENTDTPLEAVMSTEAWGELYERLAMLIRAHSTTLVFVNTRRLAERAARHLAERLGEQAVTAHHGSLAREQRLQAERNLKAGNLKALVATASLELGIDIGNVDLVCQIGSPRSIVTLLQRVGRSGHVLGAVPKGRLLPTSRDELVECVALLDAVRRDELERLRIPDKPLDVLAQQVVAEIASREWGRDALLRQFKRAWPYRSLSEQEFDDVVDMLANGFSTCRGRRSAYVHYDVVNRRLRARRGARLTALTNGGAIPDQFDYDVVLEPEEQPIGTLNEDFAFESLPGDIFQLGNTSYRILRVEQGKVRVEDAQGQPPNIPFWFGEAPGRSDESSAAVSRFRAEFENQLCTGEQAVLRWLERTGIPQPAARHVFDYLAAARAALTRLPTHEVVIFERFFDQSGDTHLVIHAPFGSRINRAWGLALRKRFCRKFNFELQAAALEDTIVLSLSSTHSFPLDEVKNYLRAETVEDVLKQALLAAPMFTTHWRWNGNISLAVRRNRNGKRIPAQLQRMDAEDLIAVVFPDQIACQENIVGQREIPDHPLVQQTIDDCLHRVMDVEGFRRILQRMERGEITVVTRDLSLPSPLAQEILAARPYAFLDDAPAEERRTRAVQSRGFMDPRTAADLGRLDPAAIDTVRQQAWPDAHTADELHDALVVYGFLTANEGERGPLADGEPPSQLDFGWRHLFDVLVRDRRATRVRHHIGGDWWVAAERLQQVLMLYSGARPDPHIEPVTTRSYLAEDADTALRELLRSRLEGLGPVTARELSAVFAQPLDTVNASLHALEVEGFVMQGDFGADGQQQWCDRRLLARIHRYTVKRLREEIEPVTRADFMRFLFDWQRVTPELRTEGGQALLGIIEQLEGFECPAAAWEAEILSSRQSSYDPSDLDRLCLSGRVQWRRMTAPNYDQRRGTPIRTTPITLILRQHRGLWEQFVGDGVNRRDRLSNAAHRLIDLLSARGALFFDELVERSGLLRTQVEQVLGELVAVGVVTSDGFNSLRSLLLPPPRRRAAGRHRRRVALSLEQVGRWVLLHGPDASRRSLGVESDALEQAAWMLLRRYGVVFRRLLDREAAWLPPWRLLLPVLRRLEARGEIRGGRFVAGFAGEQFALTEAVGLLRETRRRAKHGTTVSVSGADPLNLIGIITPGPRLPALAGNRVLFRDGVPIASQVGKQVSFAVELDDAAKWDARNALIRRPLPVGPRTH